MHRCPDVLVILLAANRFSLEYVPMMQTGTSDPILVTDVPLLPPRAPATHKGQVGRVAIIAGSRGMSGAAVLCGLGALRGGAGLVRVYCPESIQPILAASEPCLMTYALPETRAGVLSFKRSGVSVLTSPDWSNVVAMGPGLGRDAGLGDLVNAVFQTYPGAVLLDADALNAISASGAWTAEWWRDRQAAPSPTDTPASKPPVIVTPHPGEMELLRRSLGISSPEVGPEDSTRIRIASEFARMTSTIVVLKGHRTVVATSDRAYVNTTGNPGMAAGGMGDVLTGLIAALIGQGMAPFDACCLAVYAHGLAGDRLAQRIGPVGFLAREVADELPGALAESSRARIGFL
jgi:NAD(P)H-hydrate epimerase